MKKHYQHRVTTGVSTVLLVIMLATSLLAGFPSLALAQDSGPEQPTETPQGEVDPTATPETPQQTDTPTLEPETPTLDPNTPEPQETSEITPTAEPTEWIPTETVGPTPESTETEEPLDPSLLAWSLVMELPVPAGEVQAMGGAAETGVRLLSALDQRVDDEDVEVEILSESKSSEGTSYQVALEGTSAPGEFREILFAQLGSDFDLLGGAVELIASGSVTAGQAFDLTLEARPGTGYVWSVESYDAAVISLENDAAFASKANTPGSPAWETIRLRAIADGETSVRLSYRRPFEADEAPTRRLELQAVQLPEQLDLSSPIPTVASAQPDLPGPDEAFQSLQSTLVGSLPGSFDWRSQGKVTAVRDQGTCGSCWAFGTVGVMESALLIQSNTSVNLSEQYLISCNNNGWGCGGGWWAHDLHTNTSGKNNNPPGAVLESDAPYSNSNGTCSKVYNHPYKLAEWRYVGSATSVPSVDAIKTAIYNYGPVAVAVCSIGMDRYTGGVYSTNNTSCGGGVDHAVILVGWNNADQTWIMRNSWGSRWGESGYMRIKWGASNVGYGATYVVANKTTTTPPSNDDFNSPKGIKNPGGVINYKNTISVSSATVAGDDPLYPLSSGATTGKSTVWYRFSTVNGGTIEVSTASSTYDTLVGVWKGGRGSLEMVSWNDNASSSVKTSKVSFKAAANTTFYVGVASKSGSGSKLVFNLKFTPPKAPNNLIENAVKLPYSNGVNYAEIRDIYNASTSSSDPKFPLSTATSGYKTVWYSFKPTTSGTLTATTVGSNFDTLLGVYRGSPSSLRRVKWDDNSGGNNTSSFTVRLAANTLYRVMVSSKTKTSSSRLQLNVMFIPDTPVGAGTYDNTSGAIAYLGTWKQVSQPGTVQGSVQQGASTTATANLTFQGTGVDFIFTKAPKSGSVNVYVNGKLVKTISQNASNTAKQVRWSSPNLGSGTHNIRVVAKSSTRTNVDAFVVRP